MSTTEQRQHHPLDDWGSKDYNGPQPWDHDGLGILREDREQIGSAPNTVTPVVSHTYPILTSGSAHPVVHELGGKLGDLGFPNSVSRGENPFGAVDESVMSAVHAFRAQYGIQADPSGFGGNTPQGRANAESHIDPWTTEGILRAHKRHQEEREDQ